MMLMLVLLLVLVLLPALVLPPAALVLLLLLMRRAFCSCMTSWRWRSCGRWRSRQGNIHLQWSAVDPTLLSPLPCYGPLTLRAMAEQCETRLQRAEAELGE